MVPKLKTVLIQVQELHTLHNCFTQSIDLQKRTHESLLFYARQIEDERRVLGGEKIVVKDAAVACGCEAPGGSAAVAERRRAAARGRSLACCAAAP